MYSQESVARPLPLLASSDMQDEAFATVTRALLPPCFLLFPSHPRKEFDDKFKHHNFFEPSVHLYLRILPAPTPPECHMEAGSMIPGIKIPAKGCWARGYSQMSQYPS